MDMKFKMLVTFGMLISFLSSGQNSFQLSEQAQISIITCGPDQNELYAAFGHSAIRVYDPLNSIDDAFNYGIFDFNQPNFYLNFTRGYLYYRLGVYSYPLFRDAYISHNRFIHEQVLNLSAGQKQKLFDYLVWNAAPENQTYRYDYFYNNCATKVRDVFTEVLKEDVAFDGSYIKTDYTIRQLTDLYLKPLPWGDLGIDICLGLPMDKKASTYEYMFLPDYIESSFIHASILIDGERKNLVSQNISVYETQSTTLPFNWLHPLIIFGIILLLGMAITWRDWKKRKTSRWFDNLLFILCGLIGLLLLMLWTMTDHQAAARNFNLLWALPTHVVVPFLLWKKPGWTKAYFLITFGILILTLLAWPILPQQLNTSLIPILLLLLIRAGWQSFHISQAASR